MFCVYFEFVCVVVQLAQFASVLMWYNNEISCFLQQGKETQLLHVFEEDLIIGSMRTEDVQETPNSAHAGIYSRDFYATVYHTDR